MSAGLVPSGGSRKGPVTWPSPGSRATYIPWRGLPPLFQSTSLPPLPPFYISVTLSLLAPSNKDIVITLDLPRQSRIISPAQNPQSYLQSPLYMSGNIFTSSKDQNVDTFGKPGEALFSRPHLPYIFCIYLNSPMLFV